MFTFLEVLTVLLVAIMMTTTLGHALELPGKLRLDRESYLAVQPIYYPGFTIIGGLVGEAGGMLATLLLVALTPSDSAAFWLTLLALLLLLAAHGVYWVVTHPVNNFWLQGVELKGAGKSFFSIGSGGASGTGGEPDWQGLRDRWEYSHVIRAALNLVALALLTTAVAL